MSGLLEVTAALTGQSTEEFARAFIAGDSRAHGALARLEEAAESAAGAMRERCLRARDERQWASLQHEAQVFGYLANAVRHGPWVLDPRCWWHSRLAHSRRDRRDRQYRAAIDLATQSS